jgi:hypothetical protein
VTCSRNGGNVNYRFSPPDNKKFVITAFHSETKGMLWVSQSLALTFPRRFRGRCGLRSFIWGSLGGEVVWRNGSHDCHEVLISKTNDLLYGNFLKECKWRVFQNDKSELTRSRMTRAGMTGARMMTARMIVLLPFLLILLVRAKSPTGAGVLLPIGQNSNKRLPTEPWC